MFVQEYLLPKLVTVRQAEEWASHGGGLKFVFPIRGGGDYVCGRTTERITPGDVLVLNGTPGTKIGVRGQVPLAFWHFAVSLEHLFPLFTSRELGLLQNLVDLFKNARLYPAAGALAVECHRLIQELTSEAGLGQRTQLLGVVATILSAELRSARNQRAGPTRLQLHMNRDFATLSEAAILNLPMGDLAKKFCCSRRHLNRLFHQHFGLSVAELRMEMRLLKANTLLRNPDAKVFKVAEECGFNHLGLFNACFKKRFGVSPGLWRKTAVQVELTSAGLLKVSPVCPMKAQGLCPWTEKPGNGHASGAKATPPQNSRPMEEGPGPVCLNGIVGRQPAAIEQRLAPPNRV